MIDINCFTVCLHAGSRQDIVDNQMAALKPIRDMYRVAWNNRINRYPKAYPSYSQLINHSVATSLNEWMILINDRTHPTVDNIVKMVDLMKDGFACVLLYNVGLMGFSKELIRTIGWWDERFKLGGFEDRDWIYRIRQADLALYESQEAVYDYSWKSPLQEIGHNCRESEPHWNRKWENKYEDAIVKLLPEENYEHWNLFLGDSKPEIRNSWKKWNDSVLNIDFNKPGSGQSTSSMINNRPIVNLEDVKHLMK